MYDAVIEFIDDNIERSIDSLKELCRIPTVAAKGQGLEETAELVSRMLGDAGLETQLHETSGAPVVTALLDVGANEGCRSHRQYCKTESNPGRNVVNVFVPQKPVFYSQR